MVVDADLDLSSGESMTLEFKRHRSKSDLPESELIETVVCLANGRGGRLVLGVEDDGTVSGFGPLPAPHAQLAALILNRTRPNVPVDVESREIDGKTVVVITVPDMDRVVGTSAGTYKRRALRSDGRPECVPYLPEEMLSAGLFAARQDYAALPAGRLDMTDLDSAEFDRFRSMCARDHGDRVLSELDDVEICRALRVLDTGSMHPRPTIGAVLLFGRPDALQLVVPTAQAQFHVRGDDDALRRNQFFSGPLFASFDWFERHIAAANDEQELMVGVLRVSLPRVSPDVAREAVANALVHRDYTEMGAIRVTLTSDAVTVASPGGFPRGVTVQNLLDTSIPRSPILADAFRRAGLVDRAGRGISRMFRAQLLAGREAPVYARSDSASVIVDIPTADADLQMVRFVVAYEDGAARSLPLLQIRILHALRQGGRLRASELADALGVALPTVTAAATRLVERGLAEQVGAGRTRAYMVGAAFYAAAEDHSAYVRVRAADPVQQKHMILQYVTAYGRITRRQVMELCAVEVSQARSLLRQLVDEGDLVLVGERRASHYVASETAGSSQ